MTAPKPKRAWRKRHTLSKVDLLDYALEGAKTRLGVGMGFVADWEIEAMEKDINEIIRRIKLCEALAHLKK